MDPSGSVGFKIWEKASTAPDGWVRLAATVGNRVPIINAVRDLVERHNLVLFKVPRTAMGQPL